MILESRWTDFVGSRVARDGKVKGKLVNGLPEKVGNSKKPAPGANS